MGHVHREQAPVRSVRLRFAVLPLLLDREPEPDQRIERDVDEACSSTVVLEHRQLGQRREPAMVTNMETPTVHFRQDLLLLLLKCGLVRELRAVEGPV